MLWPVFRRALFSLEAENAHHLAMRNLKWFSRLGISSKVVTSPTLEKEIGGVRFPNPVGLAAGFDKNGECLLAWQHLGFGCVEVGTVTALPQIGNPKPRVFRLPRDLALMNRLGFNNVGAIEVARNVERQRRDSRLKIPIGINIGKSKIAALEDAPKDYLISFTTLADLADYVVINVSSPNTPGLRDLQAPEALQRLLEALCGENKKRKSPRPMFLKLAPDLHVEDAMRCGELGLHFELSGLVVSNTTISRDGLIGPIPEGTGGISGQPLLARSNHLLSELHRQYRGRMSFVGVGGVMDVESARSKINAGADLIQVYTGFIYGGPGFAKKIVKSVDDRYGF